MNPTQQSQFDQLESIKNQLTTIRDSKALSEVKTDSDVAKGLAGVFGATGNVLSDMQVEGGVLTSRSAKQAVSNADKSMGSASSKAMAMLQSENAKLSKAFEAEKKTREEVEANLSIQEQLKQNGTQTGATTGTGTGTQSDPNKAPSGSETASGTQVTGVDSVIPGLEKDPVADAIMQAFNERVTVTNSNLDRLNDFVESSDEDTISSINSLKASAKGQIKRVEAENIRLAQAARVAGIVSGRGMYSPEEHEGLISETIQDGLDRIVTIENTRDTAVLEAKKAQREFNYKAYVEMADMVTALSDLKRDTIIDMKDRLIEIETQEREKQKFDQEQADRNAFIIAPELMDSTADEIYKAALANNIEPGLLAREVAAYKDEQQMNALDIEAKRENILSSQSSRRLDQARFDRENSVPETEEALTSAELEKFSKEYGIRTGSGDGATNLIPTYWTRSDLNGFISKFPNAPAGDLPQLISQYEDLVVADSIPDEAEREAYLASKAPSTDDTVADVTNRIQNDSAAFFRQAKKDGDASMWRNKEDDVEVWVSKPTTREKIAQLANEGLTSYQIFEELKRLYGEQ